MLQRKNGATLAEIMEKMGWQKHTVRGFMAGAMKKAGYTAPVGFEGETKTSILVAPVQCASSCSTDTR